MLPNLKRIVEEERKASPGKFRLITLIDSEFYQIEEDQDSFQDAHDLGKKCDPSQYLMSIFDDQGRARSPQDEKTGIFKVWNDEEVETMAEQAFGELEGLRKHFGLSGSSITANQLGLVLQLAKKEFGRIKNPPTLFSVTTIVPGWPSEESRRFGGKRTPIICTSLEIAKDVIERNVGDIFETTYRYAVITTIFPDVLYSYRGQEEYKEYWYVWEGDYETGKYVPCEKPKEYEKIVGWGIG